MQGMLYSRNLIGTTVRAFSTVGVKLRRLSLEEVTAFCKHHGFIYPGSELYGSIGTGYDYGPLGVALKRNVQEAWWKDFIDKRSDCVGIDTALLMNPKVWESSGHVQQFVDPLSECVKCQKRVRADKAVSAAAAKLSDAAFDLHGLDRASIPTLDLAGLARALVALKVKCPSCGALPCHDAGAHTGLQSPRMFNLLFKTHVGPVEPSSGSGSSQAVQQAKDSSLSYLRPETAQGVYIHFANVLASTRKRLPFGVGQVGRSFRNEIAVGNFIFRTREFDQMELQYFCAPEGSAAHFDDWVDTCHSWLTNVAGLSPHRVRRRVYAKGELAHYALATTDLEFEFPFGWDELWGIANRGDFDLRAHSAASGVDLVYKDPVTNKVLFPHAVEPALGANRLLLAMLCDGLVEETLPGAATTKPEEHQSAASSASGSSAAAPPATRLVFRVKPALAPFRAAVLPLLKKDAFVSFATQLHTDLLQHVRVEFDTTQSIGKRYRRQDAIGTPLCVTVDERSLVDGSVTVRDRDTMAQTRVQATELVERAAAGKLLPEQWFPRANFTELVVSSTS